LIAKRRKKTMLTKELKRKYNALEQCRAVLLVWSGRRSIKEVCREMNVSGSLLAYWQDKAMEGLIAALMPREGREVAEKGPALSASVKRLLEKKAMEQDGRQRAQARTAGIVKRVMPSLPPVVTKEG
jgi:transposase-like protein